MAFDLSGFLGAYGNTNTTNVRGNGDVNISGIHINNSAISAKLLALLPGQMVQGEVVGMQGNQVQLLLGNEMLLNASLENQIGINIGQLMSFQVKSNSGSLLSLIPLSVNLTNDENVMKALQEASLPITDKTVEMVNSLMKEGMPIDKETLVNINKEFMTYPDADVETVVQLERLKIPVTSENIAQFEAYKNYNHKLSDGIQEFLEQLNTLINAEENGESTVAGSKQELFQKLLDFFSENTDQITENRENAAVSAGQETEKGKETADIILGNEKGMIQNKEAAENIPEKTEADFKTGSNTIVPEKEVLNAAQKENFISLLKEIGVPQKVVTLFENGQLTTGQLAKLLQNENLGNEQLSKLFSSKEFGKLLQNELADNLLLKPEQITKERIEEYYTDLKNQTTKLMQILESTGRADTPAAKTLQNLNQNVDFLNQLNQMVTYVQLPLKMASDTAHGDLYVYTNKKNLAKKDGNFSALLHLDMPHLGMVDVYVAMQSQRVSTKFYVQDEAMLDFLEERMDLLTKRLEKKGYQSNVQMVLKEKEKDENMVIEEILKQDKNIPKMSRIATQSFDVRA